MANRGTKGDTERVFGREEDEWTQRDWDDFAFHEQLENKRLRNQAFDTLLDAAAIAAEAADNDDDDWLFTRPGATL